MQGTTEQNKWVLLKVVIKYIRQMAQQDFTQACLLHVVAHQRLRFICYL